MGGVCFFFPIEHHCLVDDCYSLNINIVGVVVCGILIIVKSLLLFWYDILLGVSNTSGVRILIFEDGVAAVLAVTSQRC